ncbi:hypothetical protein ENSA5_68050 [Enhygromyxa salina]|uniref:Lipoprotein n=1 Tax=Enhygromyxa salina TaxID=215803 RepID=A0A2S9XB40_9BACT|nr:hypothetical protein [Enhygromyxa salina]PRP90068.1 hypothetical protein ENSA5_68050 [Enhygromyxa salina]
MRSFLGPASRVSLFLPLVLGCGHGPAAPLDPPGLTDPPPPALFVEHAGELPPDVVARGPVCPAEVGVAPTAFFDEHLLVRLPPGLEGEQVPEQSPTFARSAAPLALGCAPDLAASVFLTDQQVGGSQPLARAREQLFANLNLPERLDMDVVEGSDEGRDISLALSFPDHPVWGETQLYLRMIESYGRVYAIGFFAERHSYAQLEPLFAVSAATMIALPG